MQNFIMNKEFVPFSQFIPVQNRKYYKPNIWQNSAKNSDNLFKIFYHRASRLSNGSLINDVTA